MHTGKLLLAKDQYIINTHFNHIIITEKFVSISFIFIIWCAYARWESTITVFINTEIEIVMSLLWGEIYILYITY